MGKLRLLKIIARVPQIILMTHKVMAFGKEKKEKIMLSTLIDVETIPFVKDAIAYFFIVCNEFM